MSEFLFLYRNGEKLSPEQMQQQMGRWMAWGRGRRRSRLLLERLPRGHCGVGAWLLGRR